MTGSSVWRCGRGLWMLGVLAIAAHAMAARAGAAQTKAPAVTATPIEVEVLAKGLNHPWGLQFLSDGRMLVTERAGRIRVVTARGDVGPPISGVPKVAVGGQGGLFDVALAPDFAASGRIVFSCAEPRADSANGTAVAVAKLVLEGGGGRLEDLRVIFRQEPAFATGLHFGGRIALARDGTAFVTLGERFQKDFAQDLTRHWGKVVRIGLDGKVPAGNPFVGRADAKPEIWSWGHRNPQSAAIHPVTGKLWIVEHGPRGGDEVNVPEKGKNYGWPVIGYGIDYSGARIHEGTHKAGMEQPIYYWVPSIAPSGMAFYAGDRFAGWRGNLLIGALAGQALHRLVLDGETVVGEEVLLKDRGERIRDVRVAPDGAVIVLTDDTDGRILRVLPKGGGR